MSLTPEQWVLAVVAALLVGVAKTGIAGIGMLFVVIFAQILPAKQATGLVLPLLCFGDLVAVAAYRQHAAWRHVWRLFPWTALGVVVGYFVLSRIGDQDMRQLIGGIVVTLVAVHLFRRWRARGKPTAPGEAEAAHPIWFAPVIGILAGFTTLVANAAGPLMAVYLLAMRLPKLEYVGTAAVFFLLLNLFKVPFMVSLGLITQPSFALNLWLAPAVLAGALAGRKILPLINQKMF
ncbi:MAG: sulfite exporter TauE/SafE family protein, partial [Opitutaceae bacterium]|nr:sulfite exporter TauE/SafE family protein [Opitutaceae bacterium]